MKKFLPFFWFPNTGQKIIFFRYRKVTSTMNKLINILWMNCTWFTLHTELNVISLSFSTLATASSYVLTVLQTLSSPMAATLPLLCFFGKDWFQEIEWHSGTTEYANKVHVMAKTFSWLDFTIKHFGKGIPVLYRLHVIHYRVVKTLLCIYSLRPVQTYTLLEKT